MVQFCTGMILHATPALEVPPRFCVSEEATAWYDTFGGSEIAQIVAADDVRGCRFPQGEPVTSQPDYLINKSEVIWSYGAKWWTQPSFNINLAPAVIDYNLVAAGCKQGFVITNYDSMLNARFFKR